MGDVKKLIATSLVLVAFGIVGACSQGDTHPPFLGDCDACGQPIVSTGGDGATDGPKADASTIDSSTKDAAGSDSSTNDGGNGDAASDAASNDGALLDSNILD